jgi:hypothetical protein
MKKKIFVLALITIVGTLIIGTTMIKKVASTPTLDEIFVEGDYTGRFQPLVTIAYTCTTDETSNIVSGWARIHFTDQIVIELRASPDGTRWNLSMPDSTTSSYHENPGRTLGFTAKGRNDENTQILIEILDCGEYLIIIENEVHETPSKAPDGYVNVGFLFQYPYLETVEYYQEFQVEIFSTGGLEMKIDGSGALHYLPSGETEFLFAGKFYTIPLSAIDESVVLKIFIDNNGIWVEQQPEEPPPPPLPSQNG